MARPLRVEYPGAWYHVLNRGRRKEKIFFDNKDRKYFLFLLKDSTVRYRLEVHAYSLMPNHYHLLIRTPNGNLSRIMRHIDGVYTQYINQRHKYDGSLFKGRFKSIVIEREQYLTELARYIHRNPLKARIEKKLGEHAWTSHRAYMNKNEQPKWLCVNDVLERFSTHEKEALNEFNRFVGKNPPRELEKRLDGMNWPSVLGGESLKEVVKKILLGKKLNLEEIPEYNKYYAHAISAEKLLTGVADEYGIEGDGLKKKYDRSTLTLKAAFVFVGCSILQFKPREMRGPLGGLSRTAITNLYNTGSHDYESKKGCYQEINKIINISKRLSN